MRGLVGAVALLALGAAGVLLSRHWRGIGATRRPDPAGDSVVARRVESFLRREFGPKAEDFAVEVRRGRVVLRGALPTVGEMSRLEEAIRHLRGVVDVANLLRLDLGGNRVLHGRASEAGAWLS